MSWFSKKVKAELPRVVATAESLGLPEPVVEKANKAVSDAVDLAEAAVSDAVVLVENAVSATVSEAVKSPSRAPHILCAPIAYLFCLPCRPFRKPLTSEAPQLPAEPSGSSAQVEVVPESKVTVSGAEPVQEKTTQASSEELLNNQTQPVL